MVGLQYFLRKKGWNLDADGVIGPKTKEALLMYILKTCNDRKYRIQEKALIWIRTDNELTNTFDDFVVLLIGKQIKLIKKATTTAGDYYIFNPLTSGGITGTAVTTIQQAVSSHRFEKDFLGLPYFRQQKPITIFRDWNKDRKIDQIKTTFGMYGIHLHHMGLGNLIGNWSAGCNGTSKKDWQEICLYFNIGDWVDYTLID